MHGRSCRRVVGPAAFGERPELRGHRVSVAHFYAWARRVPATHKRKENRRILERMPRKGFGRRLHGTRRQSPRRVMQRVGKDDLLPGITDRIRRHQLQHFFVRLIHP